MKTYELYMNSYGYTWLTGELIRTPDPLRQGDTKWEVYWEGGSFVFYGGKHQLKAELRKMAEREFFGIGHKLILGKEVKQ